MDHKNNQGLTHSLGLVKNLLPEEVIDQAEKLLPVFMWIPQEGPGAQGDRSPRKTLEIDGPQNRLRR